MVYEGWFVVQKLIADQPHLDIWRFGPKKVSQSDDIDSLDGLQLQGPHDDGVIQVIIVQLIKVRRRKDLIDQMFTLLDACKPMWILELKSVSNVHRINHYVWGTRSPSSRCYMVRNRTCDDLNHSTSQNRLYTTSRKPP